MLVTHHQQMTHTHLTTGTSARPTEVIPTKPLLGLLATDFLTTRPAPLVELLQSQSQESLSKSLSKSFLDRCVISNKGNLRGGDFEFLNSNDSTPLNMLQYERYCFVL